MLSHRLSFFKSLKLLYCLVVIPLHSRVMMSVSNAEELLSVSNVSHAQFAV